MVKKDLIEKISRETGLNKEMVRLVVERFLGEARDALLRHERIELRNFGVFVIRRTAPKVGRNLKTGEAIPIEQRWKIAFKPSRVFRQINNHG